MQFAWENVGQQEAEQGDWFDDWRIIDYLKKKKRIKVGKFMMNTVKQSRKSSLLSSQKRQFFSDRNNNFDIYLTVALFASLVGTYLDLIFIGKGMYHFPIRVFPEVFSINILFTLVILPLFTILFLVVVKRVQPFIRFMMIVFISIALFFNEQFAEKLGWFIHHPEWNHAYSFF